MEVLVFIGLTVALVLGLIGFSGDAVPVVAGLTLSIRGMPRISLTERRTSCVSVVVIGSTRERCPQTARLCG